MITLDEALHDDRLRAVYVDPYAEVLPGGYDPERAAAAREEAIDQVEENADREVLEAAVEIVRMLARRRDEFTTDAVQWHLDKRGLVFREPRALGPVMRRAASEGLIVPTDRTVESVRESNHRRPIRVWRSTIR